MIAFKENDSSLSNIEVPETGKYSLRERAIGDEELRKRIKRGV
jgi:hypothetical protein